MNNPKYYCYLVISSHFYLQRIDYFQSIKHNKNRLNLNNTMANVVILNQPLYGSVIWDGLVFIYTANTGFSGNDSYTYKIIDVNGARIVTNYVNPSITELSAKNITVNANANDLTEVDISELVDNYDNFSNYLIIKDIKSTISLGSVRTDGIKVYLVASDFNSTEYVDYTLTNKQYESTGRITFNITGGINQENYGGSPHHRFRDLIDNNNTIKSLSSGWNTMYGVMTSRGPIWDSVDADRYNTMSDVVSGSEDTANYIKWNSSFLNVNKFNIFNNALTANSGTWEDYRVLGNNTYDLLDSSIKGYNTEYDLLLQRNPIWSGNTYIINSLSGRLERMYNNMSATSTTVSNNFDDEWDSTVLYSISSDNFDKWDGVHNNLFVDNNGEKWENASSILSSLSEGVITNNINLDSTYSTVTSNSGYWKMSEINSFSASNFENWNNTYNQLTSSKSDWDNNTNDLELFSLAYYQDTINFNNAYTSFQDNSSNWNVTSLDSFSADNFENWNGLYDLLVLSAYSWYDENNINFIGNYNSTSLYTDTYNTVQSKSSNWGHTSFDSYSAKTFPIWYSSYTTVTGNIDNWGNFSYTSLTSFSASYFNDTANYTSTYNTVHSKSSSWGHTSFDTYSAKHFPKWDAMSLKVLAIDSTKTSLSTFSGDYYYNFSLFDDWYSTVYTKASTNWSLAFVSGISGYIQRFDDSFDILVGTADNTDKWDQLVAPTDTFYDSYFDASPYFKSTNTTVSQNIVFWSDTSASTILSTKSGYWEDTYSKINSLSGDWVFVETEPVGSVQTSITANSGYWNASKQQINTSSNKWSGTLSTVSSISADSLSGKGSTTLSANNLYVYGDTTIKGNLSALGKKFKVNTSLYTISGFEITNTGSTPAVTISKDGGFDKAIVNFDTLSSTVLYVKANNTVGVNMSSFPSTNALTVSGNISASGSLYPLNAVVTTYISNSGKYESTYSVVTAISSNFYSVCALSANYNALANYVSLSSTKLNYLKNNQSSYNSMYNFTNSNSGYNIITNNFISASASKFGVDQSFLDNKYKYDNLYNSVTSISSGVNYYDINILFSYNRNVPSTKINYFVSDDININSWTIVSDVATIAEITILSASQTNYPTTININPSEINRPHLDMTNANGKNYSNNLRFWSGTKINADTILQFMLTNNSLASSIMLSLNVNKL